MQHYQPFKLTFIRMLSLVTTLLSLALASTGILAAEKKAKETQGALTHSPVQSPNAAARNPAPRGYSFDTGASEVLAIDFVIPANTCVRFDSSLNLMGSDAVGISILALDLDIRLTRVIPFFGVNGAPYMVASGKVLEGDSFYPYIDSASATVPVMGNVMFIRVCNTDGTDIRYTQLTAYVSHR